MTPDGDDRVDLPLQGLLVIDFSHFLAGPVASLRLADLGARVIKIEPPDGEALRCSEAGIESLDGDSLRFHAFNRGKESLAVDLKSPAGRAQVTALVHHADVVIENFRPGVMERLGFGHSHLRSSNPRLVYCSISGYGHDGPWGDQPGQDLLAQARSGLLWLTGAGDGPPTPTGLPLADSLCAHVAAMGILAALVRRGVSGRGALVETSLLEAALDIQIDLPYFLNHGLTPVRSNAGGAHPFVRAPYGIYATRDGYLAIANGSFDILAGVLDLPTLAGLSDGPGGSDARDDIIRRLAARLATNGTADWLNRLEAAGVWCAEVLDWPRLAAHPAFAAIGMTQVVRRDGVEVVTTRLPFRLDGRQLTSGRAAPRVGENAL